MKHLYIFSKSDLKLTVIRNFRSKFVITGFLALLIVGLSIYSLRNNLFAISNTGGIENELVQSKLSELMNHYSKLNKNLDSILLTNNQLRIAANLPELSLDEQKIGTGGNSYRSLINVARSKGIGGLEDILKVADEVDKKLQFQNKIQADITGALKENIKLAACIPSINPVINGSFSASSFGPRKNPVTGGSEFHKALDITAKEGTEIFATGDGIVERSGVNGGYGIEVTIDHGYGYKTIYAHLSQTKVTVGQKITRNSIIGLAGSTGLSTHAHLHYEVFYKGENKNPADFMFNK